MDIVLLEGLGVSDQVLERHSRRLEGLGHVLTVYEKNTDPKVQEERCRDADVVMLANMPLALSAVEKAKNLKFIDVAFTGVTIFRWRRPKDGASPSVMLPAMPPRLWRNCASVL